MKEETSTHKLTTYDVQIFETNELLNMAETKSLVLESLVILLCTKGSAQFSYNDACVNISAGNAAMMLPHSQLDARTASKTDDIDCKIVIVSSRALSTMFISEKGMWSTIQKISKNPVIELNDEQMELMMNQFKAMKMKLSEMDLPYSEEVLKGMLTGFVIETISVSSQKLGIDTENSKIIKQGDLLFMHFLSSLSDNYRELKTVAEYAKVLNVTPKYLSAVVKDQTGHSALDIIHNHLAKVITHELRYSHKSIKEISNELNFPSISFFGKFVRREIGISPRKFRAGEVE